MSRRKQARPRLCKRDEDDDEESSLKDGEETGEPDAKVLCLPVENKDEDKPQTDEATEGKVKENAIPGECFRCETCGQKFDQLDQFMDHKNLDCDAGGEDWTNDTGSRSGTPSSLCSLDNDKPSSPRDGSPSQNLDSLDPEQVPFSIGVDEVHPHGCQFCEKAFSRMTYLKVHEQVHADLMPFKCNFCSRLFRHKRSRDRHVKMHTGDKKYKCNQCNSAFARSDHLKSHMKTHDGLKPHQCTICKCGFMNTAALTTHMLSHKTDSIGKDMVDNLEDFKCFECLEVLGSATELQDHLAIHGYGVLEENVSKNLYQCMFCSESFESQTGLDFHIEEAHNELKKSCPVCMKVFYDTVELNKHLVAHDISAALNSDDVAKMVEESMGVTRGLMSSTSGKISAEILVCPYCIRDDFETLDSLELHMQSVHSVKPTEVYTCNYCNAPYKNLYSLHEHMRAVHQNQPSMGIKYPCSRCGKEFPSIESLSDHKKKMHHFSSSNPKPVINPVYCSICSLPFPNPAALQDHVRNFHKNSPQGDQLKAQINNKSKKTFGGILKEKLSARTPPEKQLVTPPIINVPEPSSFLHLSSALSRSQQTSRSLSLEHNQEQITCDQCNATFMDIKNFQAHMKLHIDCVLGQFSCKKCGKLFMTEEQLESHLSGHFLSLSTEYGCTSCMKLFNKPDELQKHLMDIHAHHLYRCSLCKEIFDSKVNIQVHFAIKHSNECKLYKCMQCDTVFRSESEWQVHVRVTHLHISKPYRCLFCKESFASEMDLQCHLATHNKPFKCSMCDESFLVEFLLDKHLQSAHSTPVSESGVGHSLTTSGPMSAGPVSVKVEHDIEVLRQESYTSTPGPLFSPVGPGASSLVWRSSDDMYRCNICDMKFSQLHMLHKHKQEDHGVKLSPIRPKSSPSMSPQLTPPQLTPPSYDKQNGFLSSPYSRSPSASVSASGSVSSTSFPSSTPLDSLPSSSSSSVLASKLSTMTLPLNIPDIPTGYGEKLMSTFGDRLNLACSFCSQTFKCKADLEKHSKIHLNTGSQKCNICDEVFQSTGVLAEHKLQHCKIQQGNVCVACKVALKSEDQFYLHSQEHGFQGAIMQCIVCRQTLASMIELQMHGKHHFQAKPSFFTCCVCLKSFDSSENLISKLNSSGRTYYVCKPCYHGESSEHSCTQCGAKFSTSSQLELHLVSHKQTFQCIKCQESFSSEYEIQIHVATHMMREGNKHECKLCSTVFDSPSRLQCHLIEHTYKSSEIRCSACCKQFPSPAEIQNHALQHGLAARRYSCGQCSQKFFFSAELENHMFEHMSNVSLSLNVEKEQLNSAGSSEKEQLKCFECKKSFSNIQHLNNHLKLHEKKDCDIKCSLCLEVFSSVLDLQTHFFASHSNADLDPPRKTYSCSECSKEFPCMSNLQGHMRIHKSGSRFPCPVCKKVFALARNLTIHMRSHSGEKPYECPVCQKRFARKENRKAHLKSHTGLRPFHCPVCAKSFARKCHVREHMRTHSSVQGMFPDQTGSEVDGNSDNTSWTSEETSQHTEPVSEEELSSPDDGDKPGEVTSTSNIPE